MPDDLETTQDDQAAEAPSAQMAPGEEAGGIPDNQEGSPGADNAPTDNASVSSPEASPTTSSTDQNQQTQPDINQVLPPPKSKQDLDQEAINFANEVALKKIHPQTIQQLYADKDFLGKAGLTFGLILSGIGSGMSGQPNALLDILNKQVTNDLEAQKQSSQNANTWLSMTYAHELQKAEAQRAIAETGKIPLEIEHQKLANQSQNINNAILTQQLAKDRAVNGMLGFFDNTVNSSPPSIQPQAQATLNGIVKPYFLNQMDAEHQQTAQQLQNNFVQTNQALRAAGLGSLAESNEQRYVPGVGMAQIPISPSDREQILSGQNFANQAQEYKKFVQGLSGLDQLNPAQIKKGKVIAAELQAAFRQATNGGVYKEGEQHFIDNIIPSDPTQFLSMVRTLPQIDTIVNDAQMRYNNLLKSKGIAPQPAVQQQPSSKNSSNNNVTNQDQAALKWAKANPNDPRAVAIMLKLKARGQ